MSITHTELLSLVSYDPLTGVFIRRNTGKITGYKNKDGYLQIRLNNKLYYAHRLAWFYIHGVWATFVDHRENPRSNNKITNLRDSTRRQNNRNSKPKCTNTSGFKGVSLHKALGKWEAGITVDLQKIVLGYFTDPLDAARAYDIGALKYHGEFAKTNQALGLI